MNLENAHTWRLRGPFLPPCAPADRRSWPLPCQNISYRPKNLALDYQTGLHSSESSSFLYLWPLKFFEKIIGTSSKSPYKTKKTTNRFSQRFIVLLVRSRELESLALWLKEPTGQNTLILEVSSLRHFCAKHRDFSLCNFCTLCRILQVRVPIASLETVQKQCRNRALTLG